MNQLLDGRYQFIKILGSDPLGRTYLVGDTQLPGYPKCVIRHFKLPERNPRTLQFVLTLLKKKAETLKKLSKHDRIPEILSYFEENNSFYLVEEFVLGRSLAEDITPNHPLPEARVVQILWEVLEILVVVHGWGLLHRSISPSCLIRRQSDGTLMLTGFGIFKEIGAQASRSPEYTAAINDAESIYTPPDQLQGQLQFNSDLYAVGMIAIQALTGLTAQDLRNLSYTNSAGVRQLSWHDQTHASQELTDILDRMVHSDSKQRFQQTTEVLEQLRKTSLGRGVVVRGAKDIIPQVISPIPVTMIPQFQETAPSQTNTNTKRFWLPAAIAIVGIGALLGMTVLKLPQSFMAQYLLNRGSQQQGSSDSKQAIASYSQAIQLNPTAPAYYNRGMAYVQQNNVQAALEDFTKSIELDPSAAQAYYERGNIWFGLGDRQKALGDYTQTIRLDPKNAKAYINRGTVRADLGDEQAAITDYDQAIQVDPSLPAAYQNRCLSRSNTGDHQGAIADCTQAINLQPNSVSAYQNRGLARRRLGDKTGAIEDFNIAIRLDPNDADPYYNRGLVRYELGDKQGAIADYSAAIQHDTNHVFAYYDRGLVRVELGDEEGAIADFQQSAKLCLDSGRMGCYQDAQYQLKQLQPQSP